MPLLLLYLDESYLDPSTHKEDKLVSATICLVHEGAGIIQFWSIKQKGSVIIQFNHNLIMKISNWFIQITILQTKLWSKSLWEVSYDHIDIKDLPESLRSLIIIASFAKQQAQRSCAQVQIWWCDNI